MSVDRMVQRQESALKLAVDGPVLQAYLLGLVPFETTQALQRQLVYQVSGDPRKAAVILCEHPTQVTIGRQGSRLHLTLPDEALRSRRWPVRWVNRGGGCLVHLPGQLALYSVLPLRRLDLGLSEYLDRLLAALAAVVQELGIDGCIDPEARGIRIRGRLLAKVGVAVQDWVSYYGAVLNVNPPLLPFRHVQCGPGEPPMTSLEREKHGTFRPSRVRQRLLEHFAAQFGFAQTNLFFEHPLLGRKARTDAFAASS